MNAIVSAPDTDYPAPIVMPPDTSSDASAIASLIERVEGPLVGLLGHHIGGLKAAKVKDQRVYVGRMQTSIKLNKSTSVSETVAALKFETIHKDKSNLAGDAKEKGGISISQEFLLTKVLAEDAEKRIDTKRGNTAVSANFVRNDHSRIIARLAAAVSRFSQYGTLDWETLTGGNDTIYNRDKIDGRIECGSDIIYIPRVSASNGDSFAWYAAVGAALGCGNKVVTDSTATDINNRVILNAPSGRELVSGCIEALTRIGNYYVSSQAGVLFSWALAYGCNHEMSLVGMTDEGGYVRKVFRRNRFVLPYGVLWVSVDRLATIPVPTYVDRQSAARFVDSILAYFGASSAISDPLTEVDDRMYPSIFTTGLTQESIKMPATPGPDEAKAMAVEHAKRISDACGPFCDNYAKMLDKMIMSASSYEYRDMVSGFMVASFGSMVGSFDRHLQFRVVAPYYWIEPQNIIGLEASEMAAEMNGFGTHVPRGMPDKEFDCFEDFKELGNSSGMGMNFFCKFTAARKNMLLQHLSVNKRDGLACLLPRQTREDGLTLVGHRENTGTFGQRAAGGDDIESFLWKKSTSKFIAPAECVQLQAGMAFAVVIGYYDNMYMFQRLFSGNGEDFSNKVKASGTQYQGVGIRKRAQPFDRDIVRANGLSAAALDTNRSMVGMRGDLFSSMAISGSGAGPGINMSEAQLMDPRRQVLTGEDPASVWLKVLGKAQRTVISHKLKYKQASTPKVSALFGSGPNIEGGENVVEPVAGEDPIAMIIAEVAGVEDGKLAKMLDDNEPLVESTDKAMVGRLRKARVEMAANEDGSEEMKVTIDKKDSKYLGDFVKHLPVSLAVVVVRHYMSKFLGDDDTVTELLEWQKSALEGTGDIEIASMLMVGARMAQAVELAEGGDAETAMGNFLLGKIAALRLADEEDSENEEDDDEEDDGDEENA